MKMERGKTIFFVASTMPAAWISSKLGLLDIKKIIVASKNLELSYRAAINECHNIEIISAPENFATRFSLFIYELLWARFQQVNVIFFHECCFTDLDLLIMLIKPVGYFFPIVTMAGFDEVSFSEFPKSKITFLIWILGLAPLFKYYRSPVVGSNRPEFAISARRYPRSIISKDAFNSNEKFFGIQRLVCMPTNKILFVLGKSIGEDRIQVKIFRRLISMAHSSGYITYTKDHPNPSFRLNSQFEYAIDCDPLIPVEVIGDDFDYVVGASSSALLHFGDKSISIVNLMSTNMSIHDLTRIKNHFEYAVPGNCIKYIDSYDEFKLLLE